MVENWNKNGLGGFILGAYDNLIGGDPSERIKNQNHILKLVRMAALYGGDANGVMVGTFVGYNHELGVQDRGFEKNLLEYARVFGPIVRYAEDLGVTLVYENCPMEGWQPKTWPTTMNNLPATLAARKLMYALISSKAHGETYDPSHDVWQGIDPADVIARTDLSRLRHVHVKATLNRNDSASIYWGNKYPMQSVDKELAATAGVPTSGHEWNRHHYEPMLPGFGGTDSMDWRKFIRALVDKGYKGALTIENEADNSSHTGNLAATIQGFRATVLNLAPLVWNLDANLGWAYNSGPLVVDPSRMSKLDIPLKTMDDLT